MNAATQQVVAQSVYATEGLKTLSRHKEMFCFHLASGARPAAAGKAVGAPAEQALDWAKDPQIREVVDGIHSTQVEGVRFTREKLSSMLLQSYYKAATATEEIAAVREIGKLQGLYAPETTELNVNLNNSKQLETLSDAELAKLAGMDNPTVIEGDFEEVSNA